MRNQLTFAFIFARGGSKGLPRKNILPIAGLPMLAHGIRIAQEIEAISAVFVSTDCAEIAEVGKAYGAEIIDRPKALATDTAPEWLAWQHAIQFAQENHGRFENFLSLPPTAPCRRSQDVTRCLERLKPGIDLVVTMTKSHRSPWFNMVSEGEDGKIQLINSTGINRRQDAPQSFDLVTVAYAAHCSFILSASNLWDGNVRGVEVPAENAIDIDSPLDYAIAQFLLEDYLVKKITQ